MQKTKPYFVVLTLLAALFFVAGCPGNSGPRVYLVTGKVTLDGEPLPDATLIFSPVSQSGTALSASGRTNADGVYFIQTTTGKPQGGTTPGEYKVCFSKTKELWDGKSYLPNPGGEPIKNSRAVNMLPQAYTLASTTPCQATVTTDKSKNVFDFDLKSK
ncbi:MAG: hypothetical protein FWC50_00645 [Planctomycetaceae bacterium]|nr:hypothetical protein [Planctomycetaceae bacterium]